MSTPPLVDVDDVRARVDARVDSVVDDLAGDLAHVGAEALLAALREFSSGGKRLRAAFCYWSWRAHAPAAGTAGSASVSGVVDDPGATVAESVIGIGAALELFQAAALVHDDVMDDSDTRRGRPATHRAFAAQHLAEGWAGPAGQFGDSAAILLGDLALIAADRAFADAVTPLPASVQVAARRVYDLMRAEVIAGQYRDVLAQVVPWGADPTADEALARTVVRAKSARYSVEHPITLGAVVAGAAQEALDLARRAGLAIGEAFQLRDDLLGVFGDPATTGKPAGDDLREGKRTVLVARALRLADDAGRAALLAGLGRRDLTEADVARLRDVLRMSGAVDQVETLIDELAGPALEAIAAAPLAEPGRTMLGRLGRAAVDRHA